MLEIQSKRKNINSCNKYMQQHMKPKDLSPFGGKINENCGQFSNCVYKQSHASELGLNKSAVRWIFSVQPV